MFMIVYANAKFTLFILIRFGGSYISLMILLVSISVMHHQIANLEAENAH